MEGAGKECAVGVERSFTERQELFHRVAARPFDLRGELARPLESVSVQVQLYEWEYLHETRTERGRQVITVISPLTWVVPYSSTYSLPMLQEVVAGKQDRDDEGVLAFVLRVCLMHLLFAKHPTLTGIRTRVGWNASQDKAGVARAVAGSRTTPDTSQFHAIRDSRFHSCAQSASQNEL